MQSAAAAACHTHPAGTESPQLVVTSLSHLFHMKVYLQKNASVGEQQRLLMKNRMRLVWEGLCGRAPSCSQLSLCAEWEKGFCCHQRTEETDATAVTKQSAFHQHHHPCLSVLFCLFSTCRWPIRLYRHQAPPWLVWTVWSAPRKESSTASRRWEKTWWVPDASVQPTAILIIN